MNVKIFEFTHPQKLEFAIQQFIESISEIFFIRDIQFKTSPGNTLDSYCAMITFETKRSAWENNDD